jgi:hypothetical protein
MVPLRRPLIRRWSQGTLFPKGQSLKILSFIIESILYMHESSINLLEDTRSHNLDFSTAWCAFVHLCSAYPWKQVLLAIDLGKPE